MRSGCVACIVCPVLSLRLSCSFLNDMFHLVRNDFDSVYVKKFVRRNKMIVKVSTIRVKRIGH